MNFKIYICSLVCTVVLPHILFSQPGHRADIHPDSISHRLWADLDKGYFEFHKRTFAMSTINEGAIDDYFTVTSGAGLGYYSPSFKNFHLSFSGFFAFQLYQYNLHTTDATAGKGSRYERQLYDLNDVDNSTDLDRLEELYLSYERDHFSVELGRHQLESPLLNENDNRMRPNIFSGLSVNYHNDHLQLKGAWFVSETIRGTVHWYSISESMGIYGQGRNPLGDSGLYHGNISTKGLGTFGAIYEKKNLKTQFWNYTAENIFNLSFGQVDYTYSGKTVDYVLGVQGLYQYALNHGGNPNPSLTYIQEDESTYALGGRIGMIYKNHQLTGNYFGIADQGRYLFPREWGREKFYASLTRELFEGYGGLNAYVLKYKYDPKERPFWVSVGAGYIDQPSNENLRLSKYALDDYYHFTGKFDYKFQGYFEGLDLKCIVVYKKEAYQGSMTAREKINKADMINLNLVVDYRF
ncbi:MAG: OprD family outer membrane porin [Bacteroidota bacterium]